MSGPQAVAEVIKATGYTAMARQYIDCPELRDRIRTAMTKIIAANYGKQKAMRFSILAAASRKI